MVALNDREKRLATITGLIALIGVLYIGFKMYTNSVIGTESDTPQFEDLYTKINNVESQKEKNLAYRKRIGNLNGRFVSSDEMYQVLYVLEQVAGKSGVSLKRQDPQINQRARPLPRLDINMALEGKFENLIKFLDNLRKADFVVMPVSLKTSLREKDKPELSIQMTVMTYLLDAERKEQITNISIARGEQ
ncbi:MAG: type 4a pilus biogenesis protein PilO [bacterium]|jgi:Tfp pilus assembly protein PilO